jgi:hypothetical protein
MLQFRERIKGNHRPWDSKIEFTMPGELALYRDYKPMDVTEYGSAAGRKGARKANEVRSQHHIFSYRR